MATSRRKSKGSPHPCATKARSPRQSGKGQGQGPGTKCHYLHPMLLGSSIKTGSIYCPTELPGQLCPALLSCWSSCNEAAPAPAAATAHSTWRKGSHQGSNPPVSGIGPGRISFQGYNLPCREARVPAKPLPGCILHDCWLLLAPGSSPEQKLC